MKIIFLDIDGVLVTTRHWVQSKQYFGHEFDPECVEQLKEILSSTGAGIVVSSSWREGRSLEQLQSIFELNGIFNVIGMTPVYEHASRGFEIKQFLEQAAAAQLQIRQFVILDDEEEMGELKAFLIETAFQTGITTEVKEAVVRRLLGRK